MSRLSKSKILFLVSLLTMGLVSTAHSSFIKQSEATSKLTPTSEPVCYVTNSSSTTYYTDIDKALVDMASNNTSDTLYVIPSLTQVDGTNYYCTNITMDGIYTNNGVATRISGLRHVVNKEDTLCLPYAYDSSTNTATYSSIPAKGSNAATTTYGSFANTKTATNTGVNTNNFADATDALVKQNRKILLTIASNVTLTVNGTLNVGGIIGRNTASSSEIYLAGQTTGSYCEILLEDAASIIVSGGKLELLGYIKEKNEGKATLNITNNSEFWVPLVFYDYRGGNQSNALNEMGIFPIDVFDFPNSQVVTTIDYGSLMIGYVSVWVSSLQANSTVGSRTDLAPLQFFTVPVIGREEGSVSAEYGMINLKEGSSISYNYRPSTNKYLYTTNDTKSTNSSDLNITDINAYGGFTIRDISLSIDFGSTINAILWGMGLSNLGTIATAGKMFPISYKLNISLHPSNNGGSNETDFHVQSKFLPGSVFTINEGTTVNLNWNSVVVSKYMVTDDVQMGPNYYPINITDSSFDKGNLIVKGTLITSTNSSDNGFGGYVTCGGPNAVVNINNNSVKLTTCTAFSSDTVSVGTPGGGTFYAVTDIIKYSDNPGFVYEVNLNSGTYNTTIYSGTDYYWYWPDAPEYTKCVLTLTFSGLLDLNLNPFKGTYNLTVDYINLTVTQYNSVGTRTYYETFERRGSSGNGTHIINLYESTEYFIITRNGYDECITNDVSYGTAIYIGDQTAITYAWRRG